MTSAQPIEDTRPTETRGATWLPTTCVWLLCTAVLVWHARSYLPFLVDDALISLRYSQRLLEGQGLTWTEGPRVEGYTNLLWVLACAALGAAGVDLIDAARVWGFIGMSAALAAVAFAYRPRRLSETLAPLAGGLGMALTAPIAVWTIGGLETPLVAGLLAWATVLSFPLIAEPAPSFRKVIAPSLLLGLLCLTRSDGGVLCIALALGILLARGPSAVSLKLVAGLALFPLILGGGQLVFRLVYYHEWLPNPAHVKVAFTTDRLRVGLQYITDALPYLAGLAILAAYSAFVGFFTRRPRRTTFLTVQLLAWIGYLILIGGDVFPAHRHLVPSVVIAGLLVAELGEWLVRRGRVARSAGWIGAAIILGILAYAQRRDPQVQLAVDERWEWDGQIIGELLRKAFAASDPLIACDPAGCIPYFTGFRSIDMMGLNDYYIARQPSSGFGKGLIGHELGDGKYVLDREPDLILWTLPTGANKPLFPSAVQMAQDPRFAQSYRLVFLAESQPRPLTCGIFLRAASERVGIRSLPDRLVLPGVLAATSFQTPATLDSEGRLGVLSKPDAPASMPGLGVPPGRWRVVAESDVPARVRLRNPDRPGQSVQGAGELIVDAGPAGAAFDVELTPVSTPAVHVRQIVFYPQ
jgi:hypothetical protein